MKNENSVWIIFISITVFVLIVNISDATECSECHTKDVNPIKAEDTIEISDSACLKCHNPDYPPTSIGYNTHLAHIGKYTVMVDYLKRHPKVTESFNCNSCHINIGENCVSCHIKNIPHVRPPLGDNCKQCHGELDKLFRHPTIELKIHNLFGSSDNKTACTICHNEGDKRSLKLANEKVVPIQESYRLCYQCHSNYYNLWNSGRHYSNKTPPTTNVNYRMVSSSKTGWEDSWRKENTCTNCHNPHNPVELYQLPSVDNRLEEATNISIFVNISSYLYMIGIIGILILIICAVFIIKKKKLELSWVKNIDISKLKSKLKIPSISISVESIESEKSNKIEDSKAGIETTEKTNNIEPDLIIKKILSHKKDILFISGIIAILGLFYIVFGAFIPIMAVASESMVPNIGKGDAIFYTDINRVDEIRTHNDSTYQSFGDYGDVIIYKPAGKKNIIPYIHRAMYYVEKGDKMWPDGPNATYAGYITKGDNNPGYDQQMDISRNRPIRKEWIVGVAKFRIPYIGYIRVALS